MTTLPLLLALLAPAQEPAAPAPPADPAAPAAAPAAGPHAAPPGEAEEVLQELSHDLMSPYCPGRTLASCPSQAARHLEDQIYEQARAGRTREQIERDLVARFGPQIVGYRGSPLILWGSGAVAALALLLVVVAGRRWARGRAASAPAKGAGGEKAAPGGPDAAELDRLEDELDDLEAF